MFLFYYSEHVQCCARAACVVSCLRAAGGAVFCSCRSLSRRYFRARAPRSFLSSVQREQCRVFKTLSWSNGVLTVSGWSVPHTAWPTHSWGFAHSTYTLARARGAPSGEDGVRLPERSRDRQISAESRSPVSRSFRLEPPARV